MKQTRVAVYKTTNYDLIKRLDIKTFLDDQKDEIPPETIWFLATCNGHIAGFAGLLPYVEAGVQYGFLERAGVLKPYRGQGIQCALIYAREREARNKKLKALQTYVADWNVSSANNLIKCGYRLYTPYDKYGLKHCLYFNKQL